MNRNYFDSWSVLFDSHNKPLLGKLEFREVNTTSLKTIYDVDGKELSNPIYVNGCPSTQIMLGEGDYDVAFYEYVGKGNMESDNNESSWFNFKTIYLKDDSVDANSSVDIPTVVTISELKNLSNMEDGDIVRVIGYYTKEDCPERLYVWHAGSTFMSDDGGVFVKSLTTTVGYWMLKIPGSYIDVRWYGDIPSNSQTAATSSLGQRVKAGYAANLFHKDLYFPSTGYNGADSYYIFDGSNTVSVTKDIICDNGVRWIVKEGTTGTKVQCHELKKCDKRLFIKAVSATSIGEYDLEANWINTSWYATDKAEASGARVGYVIDYLYSPLAFSNTKIKVERDGLNLAGCTFEKCEMVECYKNIDKAVSIGGMTIKTDWFADGYDYASNLTSVDNQILLHNCCDADTYIIIKNLQGEEDYGDLGEQEVDATLGFGNIILENGSGTITLSTAGVSKLELHNWSGTIKGIQSSTCINAVDCWLIIDTDATVIDELALRRGSITGTQDLQVLTSCHIEDCDINMPLKLLGIELPEIIRCNINSKITMTNGRLQYNQVYAQIKSEPNGKQFTFDLEYNVFHTGGQHYIGVDSATSSSDREYTINGTWIHNSALYNTEHWIKIRQYGLTTAGSDFDFRENYNPYFDKMNADTITFYGITINETSRSRIRTDIPLIMVDSRTSRISLANFKVYAFGGASFYLGGDRVKLYSQNDYQGETDVGQSGSVQRNFLILDNVAYSLPSTMGTADEFMTWEYTSNSLSTEEYSYANGTYVGETANNDLDYFTDSLSVWQQDDSEGLPMARVGIKFKIDQNI